MSTQIVVRLDEAATIKLDEWRNSQPVPPKRPKAVAYLVSKALEKETSNC